MTTQRRRHSAEFKARVALEALKGQRTINEIAACYQVHPGQVQQWKKQLVEGLPSLFGREHDKADQEHEELLAQLYQQIGQLKVEVDWLKKKSEQLRLR
jgi:transposase-like protein